MSKIHRDVAFGWCTLAPPRRIFMVLGNGNRTCQTCTICFHPKLRICVFLVQIESPNGKLDFRFQLIIIQIFIPVIYHSSNLYIRRDGDEWAFGSFGKFCRFRFQRIAFAHWRDAMRALPVQIRCQKYAIRTMFVEFDVCRTHTHKEPRGYHSVALYANGWQCVRRNAICQTQSD